MPSLKERNEDIEPNLEFELARFAKANNEQIRFNSDAKSRYLKFAQSVDASWPGNFRDLGASITRMATLSHAGRIDMDVVEEEIARLQRLWAKRGEKSSDAEAGTLQTLGVDIAQLDRFDRAQLLDVLAICRASRTMSEAGRTLFQASRVEKKSSNDADRLRKYLARFELTFESVCALKNVTAN